MKISKTHQNFADRLNNQRALSHPDEFLGPNWKDVLNFWIYLDTLSNEEMAMAYSHYLNLYDAVDDMIHAEDLIWSAAREATNDFISRCVYSSVYGRLGGLATRELIGAHILLKQGKSLTFTSLSLLINLNYS